VRAVQIQMNWSPCGSSNMFEQNFKLFDNKALFATCHSPCCEPWTFNIMQSGQVPLAHEHIRGCARSSHASVRARVALSRADHRRAGLGWVDDGWVQIQGQISKKFSGMAKELFTDADNFGCQFPQAANGAQVGLRQRPCLAHGAV
jgi:hypothetical protein